MVEHFVHQFTGALVHGLEPSAQRLQRITVGSVIIACLCSIGVVALFITGWFAVDLAAGPVAASAAMAAVAFVLAGLTWAVVAILNRRAARRLAAEERIRAATAERTGAINALGMLPGLVGSSPIITMVSVAGLVYAAMKARER